MKPYYEQDGITIHHGDNVTVLSAFPAECIDLVVTSPPYDNLRTYGGHSWDFPSVAAQLTRVLKPGGVIVWVMADATINGSETGTSMRQALHFMDVCGLRLHDTMIWDQSEANLPDAQRYQQCWEYMFILAKGKPNSVNLISDKANISFGRIRCGTDRNQDGSMRQGSTQPVNRFGVRYNIWPVYAEKALRFNHPAIFPEALARDHILSWSNEGDTVLDPFNGSGTTTKMARECGRKGIGIEIEESYCQIAVKRLAQRLFQFEEANP